MSVRAAMIVDCSTPTCGYRMTVEARTAGLARQVVATIGWTTGGSKGQLDFCPKCTKTREKAAHEELVDRPADRTPVRVAPQDGEAWPLEASDG